MTIYERIGLAVLTGIIFFFFSERVFWSFMRPGDSVIDIALTLIPYTICAYVMLILIERFRVSTLPALFVAGVAFGWLIEGVYALTFFGVGGMPFPITIVWTGIAWHALMTVLLGWYYLRISLARRSYIHTLLLSGSFGLFWGVWALAWVFEAEPLTASGGAFVLHAFVATAVFVLAQWLTSRTRPASFAATRAEVWILAGVVVAYTALVTFAAVFFMVGTLHLAFAALYFLLRRNRRDETGQNVLSVFAEPVPLLKYLCLFVMPAVASITYIAMMGAGLAFLSNIATLIVSSLAGVLIFVVSTYKILHRRSSPPAVSAA
jgi:hypothetical protein